MKCLTFFLFFFSITSIFSQNRKEKSSRDYVPNETTAIKIAEAVFLPIYGEDDVQKHRPFRAELVNETYWFVYGSSKKLTLGGGPFAEIDKKNATILRVSHGK